MQSEKMKEIMLRIEDPAFEKVMGFLSLCPEIQIVKTSDSIDTMDAVDRCFASAIREMRERKVFKSPADYAYIMQVTLEDKVARYNLFAKPDEFIDYLHQLSLDCLPGRTTLYNALGKITGRYPLWEFAEDLKHVEVLRRRNIAAQFLSAFMRHQRRLSDGISDK